MLSVWKALKTFAPASFPRKLGHGSESHENGDLRLMVFQHMWRRHLPDLSAESSFYGENQLVFAALTRSGPKVLLSSMTFAESLKLDFVTS